MNTSPYISVRETAQMLSISEKKVMDLIEKRELQAYRIADKFLRLKREEVLKLHITGNVEKETTTFEYTAGERFSDFFYFNDFYLLSFLITGVLLYLILYA